MELSIIMPAFLAGIIVLATHIPLGIEVLKRNIIFIDLAIAQIAGLGAIAASLFLGDRAGNHGIFIQIFSLVASFSTSLLLTWSEKRFPEIQEALIGCLFVVSASFSLLLLGKNPHGGEEMKDLLAGQILWVSYSELAIVALIYAVILALWFLTPIKKQRLGFYALFAVTVTASVQLVGVYLVFASLIMPAIASRKIKDQNRIWMGYSIGIFGFGIGSILSLIFDLPTGPTIVSALFILMFGCIYTKPKISHS